MGAPHTSDPPVFDLHVERTIPAPPKHHGHASGAHDGAAAGRHFDVGISTHQTPMRLAARETDPVATPAPTIDWDAAELAGLGLGTVGGAILGGFMIAGAVALTGGLALVPSVALLTSAGFGAVAAATGLGHATEQFVESFEPSEPAGARSPKVKEGHTRISNIYIGGRLVATRAGKIEDGVKLREGSGTVLHRGEPLVRHGDADHSGRRVQSSAHHTFIGGPTVRESSAHRISEDFERVSEWSDRASTFFATMAAGGMFATGANIGLHFATEAVFQRGLTFVGGKVSGKVGTEVDSVFHTRGFAPFFEAVGGTVLGAVPLPGGEGGHGNSKGRAEGEAGESAERVPVLEPSADAAEGPSGCATCDKAWSPLGKGAESFARRVGDVVVKRPRKFPWDSAEARVHAEESRLGRKLSPSEARVARNAGMNSREDQVAISKIKVDLAKTLRTHPDLHDIVPRTELATKNGQARRGILVQDFQEGLAFNDLSFDAQSQAYRGVAQKLRAVGSTLGDSSGFMAKAPYFAFVDTGLHNFRFDEAGNVKAWFDPVAVLHYEKAYGTTEQSTWVGLEEIAQNFDKEAAWRGGMLDGGTSAGGDSGSTDAQTAAQP